MAWVDGVFRNGAPDTIRTCDLCLRRATLYPAELRVRMRPHLADCPGIGNGFAGCFGVRAKPKRQRVTRSGVPIKYVSGIRGPWQEPILAKGHLKRSYEPSYARRSKGCALAKSSIVFRESSKFPVPKCPIFVTSREKPSSSSTVAGSTRKYRVTTLTCG